MKLPNAERAVVDMEKLIGYCLNIDHPRGKHKAGAFQAVFGLSAAEADELSDAWSSPREPKKHCRERRMTTGNVSW